VIRVAADGFGQALPSVIFEFFGSVNSAIALRFRFVIAGLTRQSIFPFRMDARPRARACPPQ
jgi:hypothetical protein